MFALVPVLMIFAVVMLTMDMKRRYLAQPTRSITLTDAEVDARIGELERFFSV